MKYAIASVLLLAALAMAQTWVVEQMDSTAASGSPVELVKAADGRLWAGYQTRSGAVRVACLGDSGLSMTDVRLAYVPGNTLRPFMAAGPHGEICLSCYSHSHDSGWLYRLVGDTWHGEPYPFMSQSVVGSVAYDTAGRLHTAFSPNVSEFWAGQETDSGWTAGPVVALQVYGVDYWNVVRFTVARNGPWDFAYVYWEIDVAWGEETALMHFSGDTWARVWGEAGMGEPMPLALAPHGDGVGNVAVRNDTIMYDSEPITAGINSPAAGLAYSAEDVPLVTWSTGGPPVFAFKTDRWRTENIPGPACAGGIDIDVNDSGQVVIIYSTQDSGLWCARGTDVVGVRESSKPQATSAKLAPTVVRGVLNLEVGSRQNTGYGGELLDPTGRRVASLHRGANDVSRLAPGVYFVREEGGVSREESACVRRVVLVR